MQLYSPTELNNLFNPHQNQAHLYLDHPHLCTRMWKWCFNYSLLLGARAIHASLIMYSLMNDTFTGCRQWKLWQYKLAIIIPSNTFVNEIYVNVELWQDERCPAFRYHVEPFDCQGRVFSWRKRVSRMSKDKFSHRVGRT